MAKGTTKINMGGNLNIESVGGLKSKFDKKATEGAKILVHADKVMEIDLTGIQLLNYMQKQALKKKIDLQFKMKLEDSQREMLHKCGFDDISEKVFS
jgi:anti-anti-sigma regulatory factor